MFLEWISPVDLFSEAKSYADQASKTLYFLISATLPNMPQSIIKLIEQKIECSLFGVRNVDAKYIYISQT